MDIAYPLSLYTIIENFIDFTKDDINNNKLVRAYDTVAYLSDAINRGKDLIKQLLTEEDTNFTVPRYKTGKSKLKMARSNKVESHYFVGMGHFNQVRKDVPLFQKYGFNIIQIELGPRVVMSDGSVNKQPIQELIKVMDNQPYIMSRLTSSFHLIICLLGHLNKIRDWETRGWDLSNIISSILSLDRSSRLS